MPVLLHQPGRPLDIAELVPQLNVKLITDIEGIERVGHFLEEVAASDKPAVVLDTETNVVPFFFHRRLRTIQLGNRDKQYVIDVAALCGYDEALVKSSMGERGKFLTPELQFLRKTLEPTFCSRRLLKVGHNIGFDYQTLAWCLGLRPWHLFCTQLAERQLFAGQVHFNAAHYEHYDEKQRSIFLFEDFWKLKGLCERRLQIKISKEEQKGFDLKTPLTEAQIIYAGLDARLPLGIYSQQVVEMVAAKVERAAQIEFDAIPAFEDMHLHGMRLDRTKWMKLVDATKLKHIDNIKELDKHFIPLVGEIGGTSDEEIQKLFLIWQNEPDKEARATARKAYSEANKERNKKIKLVSECQGQALINYGSPSQVLNALRKYGLDSKKLPSTNDKNLAKIHGHGIIAALREYRKTEKILDSYGEGFLDDHIRPETGRVHSNIDQNGAETGRTSSSNPNLQNIPNDSEWRACFVASPGHKLLTEDYNGCELRIIAELSLEEIWIEAFNKGWDVHSVGAEMLFGDVWKKAADSGCVYETLHAKCDCKGHGKLRKKIKAINFGIAYGMEAKALAEQLGIPLEEAETLLKLYRSTFKKVTAYLAKSGQRAQMFFLSRTVSGRRRIYEKPTLWTVLKKLKKKADGAAKTRFNEEKKQWREKKKKGINPGPQPVLKEGEVPSSNEISRMSHALMAGIEREGKNTPIQGSNADIIKLAMGCGFDGEGKPFLWHLLPEFEAEYENMVHDELVIDAPDHDDNCQKCFDVTADAMRRAGAVFIKLLVMEVEGHIADHWIK